MIDTKALKQKILDLAMRGKLVPQDPNDEPVEELLARIREERRKLEKEKKTRRLCARHSSRIYRIHISVYA